jgi:hypothetical protein
VQTEADKAVASGDQAAFKEARRAEKTPTAPKADSRSATPARQAAPTGATSTEASEAPSSSTPTRGNAKTRLAEVDSEVAALKARLAERDDLRRREREAAPTSTPPPKPAGLTLPAEVVSYEAYLKTHPEATLEEFIDARSDARSELKAQQQVNAERQQAQEKAQAEEVDTFTKRVNDAATADPTFIERVSPAILALKPVIALQPGEKAGPGNVIATELLKSDVPGLIMEALTENPDEFAKLMSAGHPLEIVRGLARIEARVGGSAAPRQTFKQSQTPAPPTTLGRRPTDTLAPTEAAIRDGDMSAFKAARNAERAARFNRR